MKRLIPLLWLCALTLSACDLIFGNRNDTPDACAKLDPDFLDYFAFPEGSWWVYEEVNSGREDSLWVEDSGITEDFYDPGYQMCMKIAYLHLTNGDSTRYFSGAVDFVASPLDGHEIRFSLQEVFYWPGGTRSPFRLFYFPHADSVLRFSSIEILPVQETYELDGRVYGPVIQVSSKLAFPDLVTETMYAKHVGIISWKTTAGEHWVLKRYEIQSE